MKKSASTLGKIFRRAVSTLRRHRLTPSRRGLDAVYTPSQHQLIPAVPRLKQFFPNFRRFFRTPSRRIPSGRRLDAVSTPSRRRLPQMRVCPECVSFYSDTSDVVLCLPTLWFLGGPGTRCYGCLAPPIHCDSQYEGELSIFPHIVAQESVGVFDGVQLQQ